MSNLPIRWFNPQHAFRLQARLLIQPLYFGFQAFLPLEEKILTIGTIQAAEIRLRSRDQPIAPRSCLSDRPLTQQSRK